MTLQIKEQEIYLLERYISLEYFGELRDRWEALVKHVEACLSSYMLALPMNYRSRHLSDQPDIVWGHRVLPNFRNTLSGLNKAYILLSHHDFAGLRYACGPTGDYKGQMDYSADWMRQADEEKYHLLLEAAVVYARNIDATEGAYWKPYTLLNYGPERGPLDPPKKWPSYRVNEAVHVASGAKVARSGIYVPDVEESCAQFLSTHYDKVPAADVCVGKEILPHPITGEKWDEHLLFEKRPCTWYLVERMQEDSTLQSDVAIEDSRRYAAGELCQVPGFYFTPARSNSRSFFDKGTVFPAFDASYGRTIWQWDSQQDAGKS